MRAPPNNGLKLPFAIAGGLLCVFLIVLGATNGHWVIFAAAIVLLAVSIAQIRVIRLGRNPWWNRAPLDYQRDPNKRNRWRHQEPK